MTPGARLRRVEALVFRYPLDIPVKTSFGVMQDRPAVFVRAEDEDGVVGWGEAWCNFPSQGAEHRARLINELLAPLLVGEPFSDPRDAFDKLTVRTAVLAIQSGESGPLAQAIAGIDIALWDIAARRAGEPLWRFLGGRDASVRVYASGLNPDAPERIVKSKHADGHRAFKLKVGFGADLDRRNLAAIRDTIGEGVPVAVDANQAWDLATAMTMASSMETYGLAWLEEPLRADRPWSEWRELSAASAIPLAAGENISGFTGFSEALAAGVLRIVQPDAAKWGGLSGCLEVAHGIRRSGASFYPHYLGGGIGLLASAHLLAAADGDGMLEIDANANPLREALCGPVADVKDGRISLGEEPGLGMTPDLSLVRDFEIRSQPIGTP